MTIDTLTKIEEYAVNIVADYAESGVEDDIDEDGVFAVDEDTDESVDHEAACDLAMAIIRGMRANPRALLALAVAATPKEATDA